jgi:Helix-turn-helix domain
VAEPSGAVRQPSRRTRWVAAVRDSDLPSTAKLVAWALGSFMNAEGECYPKRETIARAAGLHPTTVKRTLSELARRGWVSRCQGGGRGHPSDFRAEIPGVHDTPLSANGERRTQKRGAEDSETGSARRPRSHEEVTKEEAASSEPGGSPPPWVVEGVSWQDYAAAHRRSDDTPTDPDAPGWRRIQREAGESPPASDEEAMAKLLAFFPGARPVALRKTCGEAPFR